MNTLMLGSSLPQLFGSLSSADNTLAALAVLLGVIAGWYLANLTQLRAKRAKAARMRAFRPPQN